MFQKKNLLFAVAILLTHWVTAQGIEFGGQGGVSYYFGDINQDLSFDEQSYNGGVTFRKIFNDRTAARIALNYGVIVGQDANSNNIWQKERNLSFKTDIISLDAAYELNFLKYKYGEKNHYFSPYMLLGLGAFYFDPKANYQDEWISLRPLTTEGQEKKYAAIQPAILYGIGIKYNINRHWSIVGEANSRLLFTDYLDDISNSYPDRNLLLEKKGEIAVLLSDRSGELTGEYINRPLSQRGHNKINDSFLFIQIGITYNITPLLCPSPSK